MPHGTVIDRAQLMDLAREARHLPPLAWPHGRARVHGTAPSSLLGAGLEYAESRDYAEGDDARLIDWNTWARTGRLSTRVQHREVEQPLAVLVDLRAAMRFATRGAFKSVVAARLAGLALWRAMLDGERTSLVVLGQGPVLVTPPGRGLGALAHSLAALAHLGERPGTALGHKGEPDLAEGLERLAALLPDGGIALVVSGFEDLSLPSPLLRRLGRQAALVALHVHDVVEAVAPPLGRYQVVGPQGRATLMLANERDRAAYAAAFAMRADALQAAFVAEGGFVLPARTDWPAAEIMVALARRMGRGAARAGPASPGQAIQKGATQRRVTQRGAAQRGPAQRGPAQRGTA